jgi:hypothetical protein
LPSLVGDTFGKLTVIADEDGVRIGRHRAVTCRCECGTERLFQVNNLRSGSTRACGCGNPAVPSQVGERYGRLTITQDDEHLDDDGHRRVSAVCDCGSPVKRYRLNRLRLASGATKSCGCLNAEGHKRHGMSGTALHRAWMGMRSRCSNPGFYPTYVGVVVCPEWSTFEGFMANPPAGEFIAGASVLGRIGDVGPYSPMNARWITKSENSREARTRHFVGDVPAMDVAKENGIGYSAMMGRIQRGWTVEDAATRPVIRQRDYVDGAPMLDVARENGISEASVRNRLRRGWSSADAATVPTIPQNDYGDGVGAAAGNGIGEHTFYGRVRRGWSVSDAATLPVGSRRPPASP